RRLLTSVWRICTEECVAGLTGRGKRRPRRGGRHHRDPCRLRRVLRRDHTLARGLSAEGKDPPVRGELTGDRPRQRGIELLVALDHREFRLVRLVPAAEGELRPAE